MISAYNLDKVIRATISDFKITTIYKYRKQLKWLGIIFRKECIEDICGQCYFDFNNLPGDYIYKDFEVYSKPYINIRFQDNHYYYKMFETYEEAKKELERVIANKPYLISDSESN